MAHNPPPALPGPIWLFRRLVLPSLKSAPCSYRLISGLPKPIRGRRMPISSSPHKPIVNSSGATILISPLIAISCIKRPATLMCAPAYSKKSSLTLFLSSGTGTGARPDVLRGRRKKTIDDHNRLQQHHLTMPQINPDRGHSPQN